MKASWFCFSSGIAFYFFLNPYHFMMSGTQSRANPWNNKGMEWEMDRLIEINAEQTVPTSFSEQLMFTFSSRNWT